MTRTVGQRRSPRLAEDVADELRARILSGAIPNGEYLPKQEDLATEFRVSLPSVREALRVLESEGLITVQRGKIGGSIVHVPQPHKVAYMLGLVLESRQVGVDDLVVTMAQIEPLCVRACASRHDRHHTVVPTLTRIHDASKANVHDAPRFARLARQFHREIITTCGNEPLIVLVGALEALWWGQVSAAGDDIEFGALPELEMREQSVSEHREMLDHIVDGDADAAELVARHHLANPQRHSLIGRSITVSASPLRHEIPAIM